MFEALALRWQARFDTLVKSGVWAALAAVGLAGALVFVGAAVFLRAEQEFGAIATSLGFAGFFFVIAAIAAIGLAVVRRRAARREAIVAQSVAASVPPWWMDPRLLTTGLALSRSLGGRRVLSLGLVGAFVVGLLLSRGVDRR
ncbi:hypothetical protein PQJ75_06120 [Rhodoplanes sp. TEM]|uniref:Uncharacterized protein n=1 Tax=Rhodoplanes tepidamans TaxID=200616 RepID=A0ABT5J8C8_RHOTP|nr:MULTISPECIES: hypothetical protein [Rhodoplanes]MDC7785661.1 hypothetical protein [Rhodoplanes tepidamans]MDC7983302.1 hypothetical protein [Rhodoplanes sp. TEM]MDQ0354772.1 hypothetical protein [Rhodoplanes tepidamans]